MPDSTVVKTAVSPLEARLERGEVVEYRLSPFPLPTGDDLQHLLKQELSSAGHKNISYTPRNHTIRGHRRRSAASDARLRDLLAAFADSVGNWLADAFPRYSAGGRKDQVTYRPQEEAGRKLRRTARNDLIHVDAFPSRPTNGWRILRVFANINPRDARVWVTSDPFSRLLERYGAVVGLPGSQRPRQTWKRLLELFQPERSEYDSFMLRFHDFLKANEEFQDQTPKTTWYFPPASVWLAMTDACSHSVLRGRFALEHSFFIPPTALALPDESPAALLARAAGRPVLRQAS
jgi:hypothetical protein